jgi:hypothetical protein
VYERFLAINLMISETARSHIENAKFEDWHPQVCDGGEQKDATDRSLMSSKVPGRQRKIRRCHPVSRLHGQIGEAKRRPGLRGLQ